MSTILDKSTNNEYHTNRTHLSSSLLKLLLTSPEAFYDKWFGPHFEEAQKEVFVEGSFVHTLILEPEKVVTDYAVFEGLRRSGKAWESFKETYKGKTLLTAAQVSRCESLFKAYNCMPLAVTLCSGGFPEHTMVGDIMDVPLKSRADYINIDAGYIVDVKTTSMPSDKDLFRMTVDDYMYDLSASLYCDIAEKTYNKPFTFYWLVLSKDDKLCNVYKMSTATRVVGSTRVRRALSIYKMRMKSNNWSSGDLVIEANPLSNYEVEEV